MTAIEEPDDVDPEVWAVVEPVLGAYRFDESAVSMIRQTLARGSNAFARFPVDERDERRARALEDLERVVDAIDRELRGYDSPVVSGVVLVELMRPHCPLAPFCYRPEGPDDSSASGGSGSEPSFVRVPAFER
jgi:hypothetical protein